MAQSTTDLVGPLPERTDLSPARIRLFTTALVLFGERGYFVVSVRDITDAPGRKPGAICSPDWREVMGDNPPQQLANDMHAAWVALAKTGNPGWEAWNAKRPVENFDSPKSGIVYAPRDETRAAWKK